MYCHFHIPVKLGRNSFQELFQQGSKMTSHFTNEVFIYYSALHVMEIDACLDRLLKIKNLKIKWLVKSFSVYPLHFHLHDLASSRGWRVVEEKRKAEYHHHLRLHCIPWLCLKCPGHLCKERLSPDLQNFSLPWLPLIFFSLLFL